MKRLLCSFVCMCILVVAVAAAAELLPDSTETGVYAGIKSDDMQGEDDVKAENEYTVETAEDETFEQLAKVLDETVTENGKYNNILVNFLYLTEGYKLPEADTKYIAELIIGGYNAEDVINAAYFWLDTSEDIGIIEKMCDWKKENEDCANNEFWIEHAFNFLTDGRCGVLDEEEISEYMRNGVSADDIMTANKLSRKGCFTIQEILEMHMEGQRFAEIALKADNAASGGTHKVKAQTAESREFINDSEVLAGRELAAVTDSAEAAYFDMTDGGETVTEELEAATDKIFGRITKTLKQEGYLKEREERINEE